MTTTCVRIQLISLSDLEFATDIRNQCRGSFFDTQSVSIEQTRHWFKNMSDDLFFYIIWVNDERVGTISIDNKGEIGHVAVLPQWRKKGVFTEALHLLRQKFPHKVFLKVRPDNYKAIHAYEHTGFVQKELVMELL